MQADQDTHESSEPILRREERNSTNWIATIRIPNGEDIPCTVKDVSKSGAKIGVPAYHVLPDTFLLRIIGRDFVCMVKLAWRRGDYVGVRIERVGKVPPPPAKAVGSVKQAPPPAPRPVDAAPPPAEPGGIGIRSRRRGLSTL
ncbi:hypothetical protein AIGOOFII_3213 [Methylobacterium marchantiae]|nr:hypothetical protein AIGOOFII_3213 [Methylobacterium marchantiae]